MARREICPHITEYQHAGYAGDSVTGMTERREPVHIPVAEMRVTLAAVWPADDMLTMPKPPTLW